ncbi:hypothetical protein F4779DRAFT_623149 [Xylariaceae sp. FL0662B]|nr:hypothetical protein F4779DRAFT_623149 [Xylariaceae sp. FL0662B]
MAKKDRAYEAMLWILIASMCLFCVAIELLNAVIYTLPVLVFGTCKKRLSAIWIRFQTRLRTAKETLVLRILHPAARARERYGPVLSMIWDDARCAVNTSTVHLIEALIALSSLSLTTVFVLLLVACTCLILCERHAGDKAMKLAVFFGFLCDILFLMLNFGIVVRCIKFCCWLFRLGRKAVDYGFGKYFVEQPFEGLARRREALRKH